MQLVCEDHLKVVLYKQVTKCTCVQSKVNTKNIKIKQQKSYADIHVNKFYSPIASIYSQLGRREDNAFSTAYGCHLAANRVNT